MTPEPTPATTTLVARCAEDILAMVPVVLGFEPAESLVMLTFGADPPFHARADLPGRDDDLPEVVESLLGPARSHRVRQVFLVAYAVDARLADLTLREAVSAFEQTGIGVVDCLRTDGRRWWPVPGRRGVPAHGVPYDLSTHPFAAQAVFDGRVVHPSREDLRATVGGDPDRVARVVVALAALSGDPPPLRTEGVWVHDLVSRHVDRRTAPDDAEVARLLRAMLEVRVRDAAWSPLRRDSARDHVAFWTDVLRRTPDPLAAAPAALLAFAAWQSGQGALSWCALDRCAEVDPDYSLATLVADALTFAIPPGSWEGDVDWTHGLAG